MRTAAILAVTLALAVATQFWVATSAKAAAGPGGICPAMSIKEAKAHLKAYLRTHPLAIGNAGWNFTGSELSRTSYYEIWTLHASGQAVVRLAIRNKCPRSE